MKCENCGAPMQMDPDHGRFVCPYCSSECAPKANFEGVAVSGPSDLDCPLCRSKLSQASLLGYGLRYCEKCNGMLVSMDDFIPLTEDLRAQRYAPSYVGLPPDAHGLERRIECPQCQQTMDTHLYGGPGNVIIDTCENCSVHWLDRGEVHRIALAPDHRYIA
jgi:Zn-finger nucleic acid-binding protein